MKTSKKFLHAVMAIVLIFLSGCGNSVETVSQETNSQETVSQETFSQETVSQETVTGDTIVSESGVNEFSAVDLSDDDRDTPYTWLVEPTVEAEDIGVLSYYQPA